MRLRIVLDEFQAVFLADFADFLGVGTATVEVYEQNRTSALGDGGFDFRVVDFEGVESRLDEHGLQSVLRNRQNRGNKRVGWHNHLVARLHHAEFDVGAINPDECVEAVGATHTMLRADVLGKISLELLVLLALEIPARIHHATHGFMQFVGILGIHLFQVKKLNRHRKKQILEAHQSLLSVRI